MSALLPARAPDTVWRPLPGLHGSLSGQALALMSRANHILFQGTRGRGSTEAQFMYFAQFCGLGYGKHWRGVIFDEEYKNLDDMLAKMRRLLPTLRNPPTFLSGLGAYKWVWPDGEELLLRAIANENEYSGFHGHEYPYIGHNELTKRSTLAVYDVLMSCNRSSFVSRGNIPPIPHVVFSTSNPWGPGHHAVKRRFIDAAKPGQILPVTTHVFNPQKRIEEDVTRTQVHYFGSWRENCYLSPQYVAELMAISDPEKRKAWLEGRWDVASGGALAGVWGPHLIKRRFKIPKGWDLDRSFDWGSSAPFWNGWWAEANGEEATLPDGSKFCPAAGSLVLLHEWYGTEELGTNRGLQMGARDVAKGIIEQEAALFSQEWIAKPVNPGPADNQIRAVSDADSDTIEKHMADEGVEWTHSDKSPGSRIVGLQLIRDRMRNAKTGEGPAIYTMEHCRGWIEVLGNIPRGKKNPDDVDTDAEDHPLDATRYRVLASGSREATDVRVTFAR